MFSAQKDWEEIHNIKIEEEANKRFERVYEEWRKNELLSTLTIEKTKMKQEHDKTIEEVKTKQAQIMKDMRAKYQEVITAARNKIKELNSKLMQSRRAADAAKKLTEEKEKELNKVRNRTIC